MKTNSKACHAPQRQFQIIDNCLQIGGMPLTQLAEQVGTPFYAYDRSVLAARVHALRTILPQTIKLHYSIKANPMPALVHAMVDLVDGFDVASGGELKIALDTAMKPSCIGFAGPGKSPEELSQAVAAGITVNIESDRELDRIAGVGDALGIVPRVAVRVNPDFEMKSSGMQMGGGAKQFGIDSERVPQVLRRIGKIGVEFHGLHIFAGSQCLKAEAIMEAQSRTFELAFRLAEFAPQPLRLLNIGGGFGIPYFPGELPLDLAPIGDHLAKWMPQLGSRLPNVDVVIELGRYLVGEAGVYVSRVVDRKISRGQTFLIVDGGLNHHLAASGNFGQVIRKNYPVAVGNKMSNAEQEVVSVVGPLCTPLDVLAAEMELPAADVGDLVVVFQSGAYGLSASPTAFLSHGVPGEVLV